MEPAKELFLKYSGSHFQMEREGDYAAYRSYGVSRDQEASWARERLRELLPVFRERPIAEPVFSEAMALLKASRDEDTLEVLLDIVSGARLSLDTFTRVRFAEELFELSKQWPRAASGQKQWSKEALRVVVDLLSDALELPFSVDPWYQQLPHMSGVLEEARVRRRIASLQEEVGKWQI